MELKDMMTHNYGGFTLDTDKIGNTSISKDEIKLPYAGELPAPCDSAAICFKVTPESARVILETQTNNSKPVRYIVTASREEIEKVLWSFFFKAHGQRESTRFDCGLSEYWLGSHQAEYMAWHKIGNIPTTVCKALQQLTTEQRASVYRMIERMEREEGAEG